MGPAVFPLSEDDGSASCLLPRSAFSGALALDPAKNHENTDTADQCIGFIEFITSLKTQHWTVSRLLSFFHLLSSNTFLKIQNFKGDRNKTGHQPKPHAP